jgi:hypothetical protein
LIDSSDAIANTLNPDSKKITKSEKVVSIDQKTNADLNLNLMSWSDTIAHVRDLFYKTVVANAQEKSDADKMRNNAMNEPLRDAKKEIIISIYSIFGEGNQDDLYNTLLCTALILDPNHQYGLSQQAYNIIKEDKYLIMAFQSRVKTLAISMDINNLDKDINNLDKDINNLDKDINNLDDVLNAVKSFEKIYKSTIK